MSDYGNLIKEIKRLDQENQKLKNMIGAVGILNINEFDDEEQSQDFKLDKDSN